MKYQEMSMSSNETISYVHCSANHIAQCTTLQSATLFPVSKT